MIDTIMNFIVVPIIICGCVLFALGMGVLVLSFVAFLLDLIEENRR
jgi:hypothetical protein